MIYKHLYPTLKVYLYHLINLLTHLDVHEDNIKPVEFERKPEAHTVERMELIDDFIRNFFIKNNLTKSLHSFQVHIFFSIKSDLISKSGTKLLKKVKSTWKT